MAPPAQRTAAGASLRHAPYPPRGSAGWGRYRKPYQSPYRSPYRAGYGYGVLGYGVPVYAGYPYGSYYDDEDADGQDAQGPVAPDYGPDDPSGPDGYGDSGSGQLQYGQGAPVSPYVQAPSPQAVQPGQDAVTLIFKDGRPPEQIHNYIVTGDKLFVGNRHPSTIPLDQLDLAATVRVNRDAGVDFDLPASR